MKGRSRKILVKDLEEGQVISHPKKGMKDETRKYDGYEGLWVVDEISRDIIPPKPLRILNLRRVDKRKVTAKRRIEWHVIYEPDVRKIEKKKVTLYGTMEEIKYWRWKEKY